MATSPTAASSHVGDTVRDNYIPLFSNKPQDYKEWRKRIKLYQKKMELQKKNKEATINLLTSLSGISWRQVEHMVDKVSEDETGFDQVLVQLDKCFKYDDRVEMPRALERFFYGSTRRGDQSLMQLLCRPSRSSTRVGEAQDHPAWYGERLVDAEEVKPDLRAEADGADAVHVPGRGQGWGGDVLPLRPGLSRT